MRSDGQRFLFAEGCLSCPAYGHECSGDLTAPCGCPHTGVGKYACNECHVVCRDWQYPKSSGAAVKLYDQGAGIGQVSSQLQGAGTTMTGWMPLLDRWLKPTRCRSMKTVGITLKLARSIVNSDDKKAARARDQLKTLCRSRNVWIYASGAEKHIEKLWSHGPERLLRIAKECGCAGLIGPGFSMYDKHLDPERYVVEEDDPRSMWRRTPKFSNVISFRLQLRVVAIAHAIGLRVIPAIYFRSTSIEQQWTELIERCPDLDTVCLDLSGTHHQSGERRQLLQAFSDWLSGLNRKVSVLISGVGVGTVEPAMEYLHGTAKSVVVCSHQPIQKALAFGEKLVRNANGLRFVSCGEDRGVVLQRNVPVFSRYIREACKSDAPVLTP